MPAGPPPPNVASFVSARCPGCFGFMGHTLNRVSLTRPASLTSWWRSSQANAVLGGHAHSQHLWGLAIDIVGEGSSQAGDQLRAMGWTVVDEGSHVHAQVFPSNPLVNVAPLA